jgi:hypothetical protein
MGGFKRFCLILFVLLGGSGLAALVLPWYGPWTREATALFYIDWYYYMTEALAALLALGLFVTFFRAVFTPPKRDAIVVDTHDGGKVTVARPAIAAQAAHIVESTGACTASRVDVRIRRDTVDVFVRVTPAFSIDVLAAGEVLHDQLTRDLSLLVGDKLNVVSLEFAEPDRVSDFDQMTIEYDDEQDQPAEAPASTSASDITVTVTPGDAANTASASPAQDREE